MSTDQAAIADEASARAFVATLPGVDADGIARLDRLVALLVEENQRQNLVSKASLETVWQRHVADSAQLLGHVPRGTSPWLDLGTGAGFPGLAIAALCPDREVLMVESRPGRIAWLERACAELGLTHARVLGARLELVPARPVGVISARAFAPLDRLVELAMRFSTAETRWVLPKGRSAAEELKNFRGWRHSFHVERSLTDAQAGIIVGELAGRKGKAS